MTARPSATGRLSAPCHPAPGLIDRLAQDALTGALKLAQIIEYGYADRNPSHYQEDHLVPLELGGAPRDPRNLWPQPNVTVLLDGTKVGSGEKDDLEDALHTEVCAGTLTLDEAQRAIARDWIAAWIAAGRP